MQRIYSCSDDVFLESPSPRKEPKLTSRHQVFLELLQTEKNYVNVLDMIMKVDPKALNPIIPVDFMSLSAFFLSFFFLRHAWNGRIWILTIPSWRRGSSI